MQRVTHHSYSAIRRELTFDVAYEAFTHELERSLGIMDLNVAGRMATRPPQELRDHLQSFAGSSGFALFQKIDHGGLLSVLAGVDTRAATYVFGNGLIALEMTKVDPRAGLYVPLRMFVRALGPLEIEVTYDVPSTLLDQLASSEITAVAESLDRKVERMVSDAVNRANRLAA
ncbi:MAG: DUF302 domain-containing protein [Kofleriaceae bacterium]|nr:DUF302 domain-containing protein [Kofleriaceae bacterium]